MPQKKQVVMLEVKFKLNVKGVIEERADSGKVDTAAIQETRYLARGT